MGLGHGISSERGKNKATKLDTYRSNQNQNVRTIILIQQSGTNKASACTYNGPMNIGTIYGPGTAPQVGHVLTQNDPPTYTPLAVNVGYPRFKLNKNSQNFTLTLNALAVVTDIEVC